MRWLGKAALQKGMSALPKAESVNYLFQRHVSRSLPASEAGFRRKFDRAIHHLDAFAARPAALAPDAVFYEFGAGWDLTVPLTYWTLGVDRQLLVDIHSNLRFELLNRTIERLERSEDERLIRRPGAADVASAAEPRGAFRDRLRRTPRRACDRVRDRVGRLRLEHEHAGAHPRRQTSGRSSPSAGGSCAPTGS